MPNPETTIKFECCHCGQSIEAPQEMRGMETECPSCHKRVTVRPMVKTESATPESGGVAKRSNALASGVASSSQVRGTADNFDHFAKILIFIGPLGGLSWLLFHSIDSDNPVWPGYACAAAFSVGIWCYLMAQLIYIRAALEELKSK